MINVLKLLKCARNDGERPNDNILSFLIIESLLGLGA
jgi:hypothetical protein